MPAKLIYWGIKARGYFPAVVAAYGKVDLEWDSDTANKWPSTKGETVFGQLPHLVDGDVKVSQSMAITRYVAKKANLLGDSLADFAVSEMLLEETGDIYNALAKAHYTEPRKDAMDKTFSEVIPAQFQHLSKLLGDKTTFASTITAGDLVIAAVINIVLALEPGALDAFPTLQKFYSHIQGLEGVAPLLGPDCKLGMYFQRA